MRSFEFMISWQRERDDEWWPHYNWMSKDRGRKTCAFLCSRHQKLVMTNDDEWWRHITTEIRWTFPLSLLCSLLLFAFYFIMIYFYIYIFLVFVFVILLLFYLPQTNILFWCVCDSKKLLNWFISTRLPYWVKSPQWIRISP